MKTTLDVMKDGEYLGTCPQAGMIYSVYRGLDANGRSKHSIMSVNCGRARQLIDFKGGKVNV